MRGPAPETHHAAPAELDRYVAIHQFAERELELAGRGELDSLAALAPEWDLLTADLPDRPPVDARPLLEQAMLLHERTRIELLRTRDALVSDLAGTARTARAARGYDPLARRCPQLDRSA